MKSAAPTGHNPESDFRSPETLRRKAEQLAGRREEHLAALARIRNQIEETDRFLRLAEPVTEALRTLGMQLFEQVLGTMQSRLTVALQEVLEQPLEFRAVADFKRGSAVVEFCIMRDGNPESVLLGQGGSVQNVLSTGLRLFALATLDPEKHRPFLVLDEQDCWLRPELVPRLVRIIAEAARELGFQALMISHHDIGLFEQYADRVLELVPADQTVTVRVHNPSAETTDVDLL
jgi:hypothetical protein